jgi:hypothetical protein
MCFGLLGLGGLALDMRNCWCFGGVFGREIDLVCGSVPETGLKGVEREKGITQRTQGRAREDAEPGGW